MKTNDTNYRYKKAKDKVESLKGFYNHLAIFLVINLMLTAFKLSGHMGSWEAFIDKVWSIDLLSSWTIWGIFLILHYLSVSYGQTWKERKIAEYMEEELHNDSKKY